MNNRSRVMGRLKLFPKYKRIGDMYYDLEGEIENGHRRFHLLMKDGSVRTEYIYSLGEEDVWFADKDLEPIEWVDDDEIRSFLVAD